MQIIVLPKTQAAQFTSDKPWACISIGTTAQDIPTISTVNLVDRLILCFHDLNKLPDGVDISEVNLFSRDQAQKIWQFVDQIYTQIDTLLVHCIVGISRSPAVAAAISKIFVNNNDSIYFKKYIPNMLVYRTLLQERT